MFAVSGVDMEDQMLHGDVYVDTDMVLDVDVLWPRGEELRFYTALFETPEDSATVGELPIFDRRGEGVRPLAAALAHVASQHLQSYKEECRDAVESWIFQSVARRHGRGGIHLQVRYEGRSVTCLEWLRVGILKVGDAATEH